MDIQIKIKILKSFVDGLQKPFYKNKEERNSKNEGRRPLSKPLDKHSLHFLKKRRYKNGYSNKNKNSKIFC
jgi:hypothetical protein